MKLGCLLVSMVVAAALAFFYAAFFYQGKEAELFVSGLAVSPAPQGSLVAVEVERDTWAVVDARGEEVMRLTGSGPPLWLRDGSGRSLIQSAREGLLHINVDRSEPVLIHTARPVKALDGGRALLALDDGKGVLLCNARGEVESELLFNGAPAVAVNASLDGARISCSKRKGELFTIHTYRRQDGETDFVPDRVIEEVNHAEHFWSRTSRFLLFFFREGSVEMVDFDTGERRWLAYSEFVSNPLVALSPQFDPDDEKLYLEGMDRRGYRQVSILDVGTAVERDFSRGRIDHYAPVLSPDTRVLAYCQGDLSMALEGGEESIYAFDFIEKKTWRLGQRTMKPGEGPRGPVFSADSGTCFFVSNGGIYRFGLARD